MIDAWFAHVERHPDSARLLFVDVTGDSEIRELQLEPRRRQRAADMAMLREFGPTAARGRAPAARRDHSQSALTGLALWWLDRDDVPRAVVVAAMLRMIRGLLSVQ